MLSILDADGRTIVRRNRREGQLAGIDAVARGESWGGSFILGVFYGLIMATIRYLLFVRRARLNA